MSCKWDNLGCDALAMVMASYSHYLVDCRLIYLFIALKVESGGWQCLVLLFSTESKMPHCDFFFHFIYFLQQQKGRVLFRSVEIMATRSPAYNQQLFKLYRNCFMRQQCPSFSLRRYLTHLHFTRSWGQNVPSRNFIKKMWLGLWLFCLTGLLKDWIECPKYFLFWFNGTTA